MPLGTDTQLQNLLALAKTGDERARGLLLDHACDRLLRLTRKMFHTYPLLRRWEAMDDVFQGALIRLHRALGAVELESVRHFFNLAGLQIRRELQDLVKHHLGPQGHGRHHHTDHLSPDDRGGTLQRKTDEPEDLSMWSEFHTRVDRLPAEYRELVNLLFYDGLTQQEAAELLGKPLRTVKRRWQEAKLLLQEAVCDNPEPGTAS